MICPAPARPMPDATPGVVQVMISPPSCPPRRHEGQTILPRPVADGRAVLVQPGPPASLSGVPFGAGRDGGRGMAVVHDTTMTPGKLELLAGWLPRQPWYAGSGGGLRKAGGFRL